MRLEHLHTYIWCFGTFKAVLLFFCCVVHACKNSEEEPTDSADDADNENEEVCTCTC